MEEMDKAETDDRKMTGEVSEGKELNIKRVRQVLERPAEQLCQDHESVG